MRPGSSQVVLLTLLGVLLRRDVGGARPDAVQMRVTEEQANGSYVGNLRDAARLNSLFPEDQGALQFQLSQPSALFAIDPTSSVITTKVRLDREAMMQPSFASVYQGGTCKPVPPPQGLFAPAALLRCVHSLEVVVRCQRWRESRFYTVAVEVVDINDNTASWPSNNISIAVPEHSPIGMEFKIPSAVDPDFLDNGRLDYYSREDFPKLPFRLQLAANRIALVVNGNIDRESKNSYRFLLYVRDGSTAPRTASIPVSVTLTDINDHRPRFVPSTSETISVSEGVLRGATLHRFQAVDSDSSSELRYYFDQSTAAAVAGMFRLDETTGELILEGLLDRETQADYVLNLHVSDGQFEAETSVRVVVTDINDEPPKIDVRWSSASPSDSGVFENEPPGFPVAYIWVTDPDQINPEPESVHCWLPVTAPFVLRNWTGSGPRYGLLTARSFDAEESRLVQVLITCQDSGQPPLIASRMVDVNIKDVNDNSPEWPAVFYATVRENTPVGVPLVQVNASDRDLGDNGLVSYSLNSNHVRRWHLYGFELDKNNGQLTAKRPLDREDVRNVALEVLAVDHGNPSLTSRTMINITVIDENDNDPEFSESIYRFRVSENAQRNLQIGSIEATDRDATQPNNVLRYGLQREVPSIYSSNRFDLLNTTFMDLPFFVTPNGHVLVSGQIDYEKRKEYAFNVYTTDGGNPARTANAVVVVYIDDLNDNTPEWIFPNSTHRRCVNSDLCTRTNTPNSNYTSAFRCNACRIVVCSVHDPISTEIARLQAFDGDTNENGELLYYFLKYGELVDYLAVNERTGYVYLKKRLEPRLIGMQKLLIEVSDQGLKPHRSQAVLDVNVTDLPQTSRLADQSKISLPNEKALLIVLTLIVMGLFVTLLVIALVTFFRRRRRERCSRQSAKASTKGRADKVDQYAQVAGSDSNQPGASSRHKSSELTCSIVDPDATISILGDSQCGRGTSSNARRTAMTLPVRNKEFGSRTKGDRSCRAQPGFRTMRDGSTPLSRLLPSFQMRSDSKNAELAVFNSTGRRRSPGPKAPSPSGSGQAMWHSLTEPAVQSGVPSLFGSLAHSHDDSPLPLPVPLPMVQSRVSNDAPYANFASSSGSIGPGGMQLGTECTEEAQSFKPACSDPRIAGLTGVSARPKVSTFDFSAERLSSSTTGSRLPKTGSSPRFRITTMDDSQFSPPCSPDANYV